MNRWENTLSNYVLGSKPYYFHIKACISRMWKYGGIWISIRKKMTTSLNSLWQKITTELLQEGPWHFDGRFQVMHKWTAEVGLGRDLLASVPIWVRLLKLHLTFWS